MRTPTLPHARFACALAALALPLGAAATARAADMDCADLENVVYVTGSSAVKPFLGAVAAELVQQSPPINIVYITGKSSCDGVSSFESATDKLWTGDASTWDATGKEVTASCNLPVAGQAVDIGVSDVYASSCGLEIAKNAKDFHGPIQSMTFVVPKKSSAASISAEAAYLTFGFGADGETPWNDPTRYFVRKPTSGTLQMLAAAIQVPASKWKAPTDNQLSGSGDVKAKLNEAQSGDQSLADLTIGILSTDVADGARDTIRMLPYQHFGQTCGYLPDSTSESLDKQNVRDGHYMVWGPLHMFARVDGGEPLNADAKTVIEILSGKIEADYLLHAEATKGVVPECAMRVTRDEEVGALASYMPEKSCECAFVKEATGSVPDGCEACDSASDCPSSKPACNYHFCEVQ